LGGGVEVEVVGKLFADYVDGDWRVEGDWRENCLVRCLEMEGRGGYTEISGEAGFVCAIVAVGGLGYR
jgi:hypothetical protein